MVFDRCSSTRPPSGAAEHDPRTVDCGSSLPSFLTDPARSAERALWGARLAGRDRAGLVRTLLGVVVRGEDLTPLLAAVRVPTLVVAGSDDKGLSPTALRDAAARIPGAEFHELSGVAHCAPIEASEALTKLLEAHLARPA